MKTFKEFLVEIKDKPVAIKTYHSKFQCPYCKRGLATKIAYNKHLTMCTENPNNKS